MQHISAPLDTALHLKTMAGQGVGCGYLATWDSGHGGIQKQPSTAHMGTAYDDPETAANGQCWRLKGCIGTTAVEKVKKQLN